MGPLALRSPGLLTALSLAPAGAGASFITQELPLFPGLTFSQIVSVDLVLDSGGPESPARERRHHVLGSRDAATQVSEC